MKILKLCTVVTLFGLIGILVILAISGILISPKPPLWAMTQNTSGNDTVYSTTYNKDQVTESFGIKIFPNSAGQNETPSTALRKIGQNESLEEYLWVSNQMTKSNEFLIFGLLDYQQIPFEFNDSILKLHHTIHMAPFEESSFRFKVPPMENGTHDFELFLVMNPNQHSLNDSFRLSTDQALLGSRRINILVGNATQYSPPPVIKYIGPIQSCGSGYVLNDGLLLTTKSCDNKALFSDHVNPQKTYDYSINIAADKNYPVSVAIVPLLDYYQVPLAMNTKENVAFFNLSAGEKIAVRANIFVPKEEGVHELLVLWIPQPYVSLDDDLRSEQLYHQWATSEPSIRVGLSVGSG